MTISIIYNQSDKNTFYRFLYHLEVIIKEFKLKYDLIPFNFENEDFENIDFNFKNKDKIILIAKNIYSNNSKNLFLTKIIQETDKDKLFVIVFSLKNKELTFFNNFKIYLFSGQDHYLDSYIENDDVYWTKLIDLFYDVTKNFNLKLPKAEKNIYLATGSSDLLAKIRTNIKRELQRKGYRVLPSLNLNTYSKNLKKYITDSIKQSRVAIHLFDEKYDDLLPNDKESLSSLEYNIVQKNIQQNAHLHQFIWISTPIENITDLNQKKFITQLKNKNYYKNSQIISGDLEEFNKTIFSFLEERKDKSGLKADKDKVYFIFDSVDKNEIEGFMPLKIEYSNLFFSFLHDHKQFNHHISRKMHQLYLQKCSICILFLGKASQNWLYINLQNVIKSLGMQNKNRWKTIYFVYSPLAESKLFGIKDKYKNHENLFKLYSIESFISKVLPNIL